MGTPNRKEGRSLKGRTHAARPARTSRKTVAAMSASECLAIRNAIGMTQDEFARAIGLKSWLTVCRWEGGKVTIDAARAYAIRALAKEKKVKVAR
jgi:DNA-binding transcriptional regulator YiaG